MSLRTFLDRSSFFQLVLARFREFYREPEAVFWVVIFPLLLTAGLGIAFRARPPEVSRIAIATGTDTILAAALARDARFEIVDLDSAAAEHTLRTGRIALIIMPRTRGGIEYQYDDTRPDARTARMLVDDAVQRAAGRSDPVAITEAIVHERGSRYIDFVVPGLLGMNLMGTGIWMAGFAIVDARKRKLLKRLIATPMSRAEYLASFLAQRLVMLVLEVGSLLGFAVLVFNVPLRGSFIILAVICLLGALCFGGLGLLIASRARTVEGASGLMNLVMLPMWVLSGVFFSSANFPAAIQPFIQALPLTAVNDALRANMLQGAGLATIAPDLAIIAAWLLASFFSALALFRWR